MPGEALSTILERERVLPGEQVMDIVAQTASALAGVIGPLALLWLAKALASCFPVAQALPSLYAVGFPLLVVDVLTPFFPLACYNGRRIWDWSRPLWAVLAAAVVALIVLA